MHRPLASWSRPGILAVAIAWLLLDAAAPARAALIVSVGNVSAVQGTSGNTLEVDLQNTGASVKIAAFSFELSVPLGSGVSFTAADTATTIHTYIFNGNSAQGPNIATATGTTLDASDNAISGSTTLGTGSIVALGRVSYAVAGAAPIGPVPVSFTGFPATSLADPNLSDIAIGTLSNFTITVTSGAIVPEPSSLVSAALGLLGAACLLRYMRPARR
jgi:hypothetical protein